MVREVGSRTFKSTERVDPAGWRAQCSSITWAPLWSALPAGAGALRGQGPCCDDILATTSEAGRIAVIDKKWVSITASSEESLIPEAGGFVLLAAASVVGLTYRLQNWNRAE